MLKLLKKRDLLDKVFIAAILLIIPLYPKFPFIHIPKTYVSIRLEDFMMALVGIYLLFLYFKRIRDLVKNNIERSIVIFFAVGFISLISGIYVTKTVNPTLGFLNWLRRVEYFLPFFFALSLIRKDLKKNISFVIKLLTLTVLIVFIYGLGQKHFGWPVIATQNFEVAKGIAQRYNPGSHLNSTFAGHYDLATYLILVLPILITTMFVVKGRLTKVVLGLTSLSALWLIANSLSRISVVSFIISVTVSLIIAKRKKMIPLVLIVSIIMFGLSSSLLVRYTRIFEVAKEKIGQTQSLNLVYAQTPSDENILIRRKGKTPTPTPIPVFEDRSTSIRLNVEWPRSIRSLEKNPLLGTGYSSITLATDSDYLRALGETGLLGFFAFFLIFARVVTSFAGELPLQKKYSGIELGFMAGVYGAITGVLLNAVFIDIFEASKFAIIFWLISGIAVVLSRSKTNEKNN